MFGRHTMSSVIAIGLHNAITTSRINNNVASQMRADAGKFTNVIIEGFGK